MLRALFGRQQVHCWVIKQIDNGLLHLCGQGTLVTELKPREAAKRLREGEYRGGVRMGETGIVLNSELFAVLVPKNSLQLYGQDRAHWRTRIWEISQVPQRCWTWTGRLITEPSAPGTRPCRMSTEDLSTVVKHASSHPIDPGRVIFRPEHEQEMPDDLRDALTRGRRQRWLRDMQWKDEDE